MRVRLTPELIRNTAPKSGRIFLWDTVIPGFGVVVHPSGAKSWVMQGAATGGKRRTLVADSLAEARRAAAALKLGVEGVPEAAKGQRAASVPLTLNALLDAWLAALAGRPVPPASLPRIRACMENHIRPALGDTIIGDLRRPNVLAMRDGLAARGLRGMANQVVAYLRAALNWAEDAQLIPEAPHWRLPKLRLGSRAHALDDAQWAALIATLRDRHAGLHPIGRLAVLALILTGCRKGEIANLRHDDVGSDGSLRITRHKTSARSGPKRVPGGEELAEVIAEARQVSRKLARAQPTPRLRGALAASPYVFPSLARNAIGRPIGTALDETWLEVRRRAGLPDTMTVHGIRGAFITQAQRMGVPLATVAAIVGHESPLTTLRYYTAPTHADVTQNARRVSAWIVGKSGAARR